MLKTFTSKIVIYTLAIGIIYPVFKPSSVEAISFSFYQEGFPDNGLLRGEFSGRDNNNDGYITFDIYTDNIYSAENENPDSGSVIIEYSSDNLERVGMTTPDLVGSYSWEYSISANQLRGYTEKLYSGVTVSQKEGTCVWAYGWDDYYAQEVCSSSPLVIVSQALPSKNNSGDNSSTKVPEPSSTLGLLAVGALSAGSALLRRQKQ